MELSPHAPVYCGEERVGRAKAVIFHPRSHSVTHIVVDAHHGERLVPLGKVEATTGERITLKCRASELKNFEPFTEVEWVDAPLPPHLAGWEYGYGWPLAYPDENMQREAVVHERIPLYEREVKRGMPVEASDGRVGKVDELLVDESGERITHLVLRDNHIFRRKLVAVPVSQVKHFKEDRVVLSLSKREVEALPEFDLEHAAPATS